MGTVFYMRKGLVHEPPFVPDPHTLLLLHGESIEDSSMYHVPLTNSGVVVSTTQSKFGGKSLHFDGKGYIGFSQKSIVYGNKDFTFDWWEYCQNNTGARFSSSAFNELDVSKKGLMVGNDSTGFRISADGVNFAVDAQNMFNNTNDQWVHWACVRHSDVVKTYRNGKLYNSVNLPTSISVFQESQFQQATGAQRSDIPALMFNGYIDEFRISDVARWSADFTPPDKPYKG